MNRAFADTSVAAIHAIRGGWGSARVLPYLDYDVIRRNPKVLIGYSDITALHMAINGKTGLTTFHGPIGLGRWDAWSVDYYKRVVMNGESVTFSPKQGLSDRNSLVQTEFRVQTIVPGKARGRLLGGNLTVLTAILGSPYVPDFENAILFCEDVGEDFYRIDRMVTQLKLAGILGKIKGFVFGGCSECGPGDGNFGALTLEEIFRRSHQAARRTGMAGRDDRARAAAVDATGWGRCGDRRDGGHHPPAGIGGQLTPTCTSSG